MLADGHGRPASGRCSSSTLRVTADAFGRRHPAVAADADGARILRSVLMKPEAEDYVDELHARVEELARRLER